MELNDYQEKAHSTAVYPENIAAMLAPLYNVVHNANDNEAMEALSNVHFLLNLCYAALGLTGESGEFAGKVSKILRGDENVEGLTKELGDTLWYLSEAAGRLNVPLENVGEGNLSKLQDRKENEVIRGSGDER